MPHTEEEWRKIADGFQHTWQFPNCIGALDGKHIKIKPPPKSGSMYFNYKSYFSIVLMALVDADYKFVYVDVGCQGRISDGGVFRESSLNSALERNLLNIPSPQTLPERDVSVPFVVVADDAFPLKAHIMKPYSQRGLDMSKRIFNYRLSRARRVVENAFGILANRFRVYESAFPLLPEKVEKIVLATCVLHNFLRSKSSARAIYTPPDILDREDPKTHEVRGGSWRESSSNGMVAVARQSGNRPPTAAKDIQDELKDYFNEQGKVDWQWNLA